MPVKLGNTDISKIYLGNTPVMGAYLGDEKVYPNTITENIVFRDGYNLLSNNWLDAPAQDIGFGSRFTTGTGEVINNTYFSGYFYGNVTAVGIYKSISFSGGNIRVGLSSDHGSIVILLVKRAVHDFRKQMAGVNFWTGRTRWCRPGMYGGFEIRSIFGEERSGFARTNHDISFNKTHITCDGHTGSAGWHTAVAEENYEGIIIGHTSQYGRIYDIQISLTL